MAEEKTINVKSDKILGSQYAQVVAVAVTDIDITLDFVYVSPQPDSTTGEVVSRITLPITSQNDQAMPDKCLGRDWCSVPSVWGKWRRVYYFETSI